MDTYKVGFTSRSAKEVTGDHYRVDANGGLTIFRQATAVFCVAPGQWTYVALSSASEDDESK